MQAFFPMFRGNAVKLCDRIAQLDSTSVELQVYLRHCSWKETAAASACGAASLLSAKTSSLLVSCESQLLLGQCKAAALTRCVMPRALLGE